MNGRRAQITIYAIEARIRGTGAQARLDVRHAETQTLFDAFKPWLMDRLSEISTNSSLAKAIRYTLGHWNGLGVFLTDGRVEVDGVSGLGKVVAAGEFGALIAHINMKVAHEWLAQHLAHSFAFHQAFCRLMGRSISNSASIRRTISTAMGERGISFLPAAFRRAFSSRSSMAKNGRLA